MTTLLWVVALTLGHGGEDHGVPEAVMVGDEHRIEASSDTFELVLAWVPGAAGETDLDLFLADPATNRPIAGAKITLRVSATGERKEVATTVGADPGLYHAHLPPAPEAVWGAIAIIDAGGKSDLLTFDQIDLRADIEVEATVDHDEGGPGAGTLVLFGVALLGAVALAFFGGRASRRAVAVLFVPVVGIAALGFEPDATRAHGGDDHGAPAGTPTAAARGVPVRIAKEIQFLLGVETEPAARRAMTPRLRVVGDVVASPDALATLRAPRSGRLEAVDGGLAALGSRVTAGQVLAYVIDLPAGPERASLVAEQARAKAQGQGAAARLDALRKELRRKEELTGTVAPQELEGLRARIREVDAELRAARAATAALDLSGDVLRMPLVAPFDGVVASWGTGLAVGGSVTADVDLVTLVAPERLEVAARVFEDDARRVHRTEGALGVRTDGHVALMSPRGAAPIVDPATRTVELRYAPDTGAVKVSPLMLGEYVAVDVPVGEVETLVAVPVDALVDKDGLTVVYIKVGAERFQPVPIVVHVREGGLVGVVAVGGGLREGDRVVVRGASFLRNAAPAPASPHGGAH